ncbi:MAG: glutamine synthetase family protein [Pseudomonadota bacterium]
MTTVFQAPQSATFANMELSAVTRGRTVPIERLDDVLEGGLPWVPTNVCISSVNTIPPDNPFGPMGETKIIPLPHTRMILPERADRPAMALYLSEIAHHDGAFWPACARSQLRQALSDLNTQYGLTLKAGFEHECYIDNLQDTPTAAYSLAGARKVSGLAHEVQAIMATAGTRLDQFVAEFGVNQFEISSPVREGLGAADHAVLAREAVRDAARGREAHATFAPKPHLGEAGSGVHIHLSLWDSNGVPQTAHAGSLTATSGAFAAGILNHLAAVMAFSTPTPNSFQRIHESSWVGVFSCFGVRNREAALRLAPRTPLADGSHPGASMEFRLCDGSANPYLALAALVRAGMIGLNKALPAPVSIEQDPATLSAEARAAHHIERVPYGVEGCLQAAAPLAEDWFGPLFWQAYEAVRRNDMSDAARLADAYPSMLSKII